MFERSIAFQQEFAFLNSAGTEKLSKSVNSRLTNTDRRNFTSIR